MISEETPCHCGNYGTVPLDTSTGSCVFHYKMRRVQVNTSITIAHTKQLHVVITLKLFSKYKTQ